ncbi:hypothetical protein BDV59DRAFT_183897 [Aspergillus ambiguus]|uniref:uncharacterized protein n=1 Tax=Aspergillus ambiguus TaxID=176160 RepID=UPI003CCDA1A5
MLSQSSPAFTRCHLLQFFGCPDCVFVGGRAVSLEDFVTFHEVIGLTNVYEKSLVAVDRPVVNTGPVCNERLVINSGGSVLVGVVLVVVVTIGPTPTQYDVSIQKLERQPAETAGFQR